MSLPRKERALSYVGTVLLRRFSFRRRPFSTTPLKGKTLVRYNTTQYNETQQAHELKKVA